MVYPWFGQSEFSPSWPENEEAESAKGTRNSTGEGEGEGIKAEKWGQKNGVGGLRTKEEVGLRRRRVRRPPVKACSKIHERTFVQVVRFVDMESVSG